MAKILIVDDDAGHRLLLKQILETAGHNICAEAENGEEAIVQYKKHFPDIITMDLYMPDSDGIKGINAIYKANIDAKIIITTAIHENRHLMQTLKNLVCAYVEKPFDKKEILKAVNKALSED